MMIMMKPYSPYTYEFVWREPNAAVDAWNTIFRVDKDGNLSYAKADASLLVSGTLSLDRIPTPLTGKDADSVDGYHGSSLALSSTGSYTGDGTANRAIPHGLGRIPKLVVVWRQAHGDWLNILQQGDNGYILAVAASTQYLHTVTAMTSTNFYVGNSVDYDRTANNNGFVYGWVAFA
jgi:alpha-D-ribose 1-methylphosphonate 5-triphosphate synthase subunit PhnI